MTNLILLLIPLSVAHGATVVTADNLESFVNRNPNVMALRDRLEAAQTMKGRLGRSFLPKLVATYGQERFSTGPYDGVTQPYGGLSAELNLYNSGKDRLEDERRSHLARAAALDGVLLRYQTLAELQRGLAHHAYLVEVKGVLTEALSGNEVNLRRARRRTEAGQGTTTDLLDFRQQKLELQQELMSLEVELGVVRRMTATLLGEEPEAPLMIDFANAHPEHTKEEPVSATAGGLLVQRANIDRQIAALELRQQRRWWTPSFDVYGYAMRFTQKEREYNPASAREDVTVGFRFTVPFFDGGEGARAASSTSAAVRAQAHEVRARELEAHRRSQDAVQKLELAHALIHGAEESVAVMSDYRKGIMDEYARGVKNSPDVLQASKRWIEAKVRYADLKKNYQFARVESLYLSSLGGAQ